MHSSVFFSKIQSFGGRNSKFTELSSIFIHKGHCWPPLKWASPGSPQIFLQWPPTLELSKKTLRLCHSPKPHESQKEADGGPKLSFCEFFLQVWLWLIGQFGKICPVRSLTFYCKLLWIPVLIKVPVDPSILILHDASKRNHIWSIAYPCLSNFAAQFGL